MHADRAGSASGDGGREQHGACVFATVQPGTYVVRVELDGFDPVTRTNVIVTPEANEELAVVLAVAHVSQSVTVTGAARTDTSVAAGSVPAAANIDHNILRKLPMPSAAIDAALPLVPGVLRSSTGEPSSTARANARARCSSTA